MTGEASCPTALLGRLLDLGIAHLGPTDGDQLLPVWVEASVVNAALANTRTRPPAAVGRDTYAATARRSDGATKRAVLDHLAAHGPIVDPEGRAAPRLWNALAAQGLIVGKTSRSKHLKDLDDAGLIRRTLPTSKTTTRIEISEAGLLAASEGTGPYAQSTSQTIVAYLAAHGPVVDASGGAARLLLERAGLAMTAGSRAEALDNLERDGLITRDRNATNTFSIALPTQTVTSTEPEVLDGLAAHQLHLAGNCDPTSCWWPHDTTRPAPPEAQPIPEVDVDVEAEPDSEPAPEPEPEPAIEAPAPADPTPAPTPAPRTAAAPRRRKSRPPRTRPTPRPPAPVAAPAPVRCAATRVLEVLEEIPDDVDDVALDVDARRARAAEAMYTDYGTRS